MSSLGRDVGEVGKLLSTMREVYLKFNKKREAKWNNIVNEEGV